MIVLATVSDTLRVAVLLDLEDGATKDVPSRAAFTDETVVDRLKCRPFGITWSRNELYVANNRQLLVFDATLTYQRTSEIALQTNTHQACWNGGRVWVASPWTNSLIGVPTEPSAEPLEFNVPEQTLTSYVARGAREENDVLHVNSLLWAEEHLFVAAHRFDEPSVIFQFGADDFRLERTIVDAGFSIHGLAYSDEELYWISTRTRDIRSDRGYRLNLPRPGFARGFAMTDEHFIVALSEERTRLERSFGNSEILVINRQTKRVEGDYTIPATGSINDLRLLDHFDYGHGLQPFWPACRLSGFPP